MRPEDRSRFDRGIGVLQCAGDYYHVPLIEAAKAGLIDLVFTADRAARPPLGRMRRSTRPVLFLLGDDDECSSGPDGWRCAQQLTRWARGAIVHGSGGKAEHYKLAISEALTVGRFLVVDTASRHVDAWMALLPRVQALAIVPRQGSHPTDERETVH
jgi:hypothetical protein